MILPHGGAHGGRAAARGRVLPEHDVRIGDLQGASAAQEHNAELAALCHAALDDRLQPALAEPGDLACAALDRVDGRRTAGAGHGIGGRACRRARLDDRRERGGDELAAVALRRHGPGLRVGNVAGRTQPPEPGRLVDQSGAWPLRDPGRMATGRSIESSRAMVASSVVITTSIRRRSINDRNASAYGAAGPRASGSAWVAPTYRERSAIPANRSPPTSATAPARASARQAASETWESGSSTSARTPPSAPASGGTQHLAHDDRLVAAGADADDRDRHADLGLDELEVGASRRPAGAS